MKLVTITRVCQRYISLYLTIYRLEYHLTWGGYRPPLDPSYGGLLHGGVPEKSWGGLTPPRGGLEKSLIRARVNAKQNRIHALPDCNFRTTCRQTVKVHKNRKPLQTCLHIVQTCTDCKLSQTILIFQTCRQRKLTIYASLHASLLNILQACIIACKLVKTSSLFRIQTCINCKLA